MKALDIALKDLVSSLRSAFALIFMFGVPLLVTGMFYFMFGNLTAEGGFSLPKTKVIVANLDQGGPSFQFRPKDLPGARQATTLGELILVILESEEMSELLSLSYAPDAQAARAAVDHQQAQVAIIIPSDFSKQFADQDGQTTLEFYQDPTLTLSPAIIRALLYRFTDGMAGIKIAVDIFLDEARPDEQALAGLVVQDYLQTSLVLSKNPKEELFEVISPTPVQAAAETTQSSPMVGILTPIMGGMMIFYAFYTGSATAQSLLKEEEERTLPRLFTTPTSPAVILGGKFLSVFLTVSIQVLSLLVASSLIFGIRWGDFEKVSLAAAGLILSASSFGIFVNSFLKTTKQGGLIFGGVLTVTGMIGMISIFAPNSPIAARMGETVALLVPQGWAVRALLQSVHHQPMSQLLASTLALLAWSVAFLLVGVSRFKRRYA